MRLNTRLSVVSSEEGGAVLSTDSNTWFYNDIDIPENSPLQRIEGLATNSGETTLGLPGACGKRNRF